MQINLPKIIAFGDYHEINDFENLLRRVLPDVKVFELGSQFYYYGLVFDTSSPPEREEVRALSLKSTRSKDLADSFADTYDKFVLGEK